MPTAKPAMPTSTTMQRNWSYTGALQEIDEHGGAPDQGAGRPGPAVARHEGMQARAADAHQGALVDADHAVAHQRSRPPPPPPRGPGPACPRGGKESTTMTTISTSAECSGRPRITHEGVDQPHFHPPRARGRQRSGPAVVVEEAFMGARLRPHAARLPDAAGLCCAGLHEIGCPGAPDCVPLGASLGGDRPYPAVHGGAARHRHKRCRTRTCNAMDRPDSPTEPGENRPRRRAGMPALDNPANPTGWRCWPCCWLLSTPSCITPAAYSSRPDTLAAIIWPAPAWRGPAGTWPAARNACLEAADGDFIAFVDDDEVVSEGWLKALLAKAQASGAAAVLGPVRAVYEPDAPEWMVAGDFHSTMPVFVGGEIRTGYTCNVLIRWVAPFRGAALQYGPGPVGRGRYGLLLSADGARREDRLCARGRGRGAGAGGAGEHGLADQAPSAVWADARHAVGGARLKSLPVVAASISFCCVMAGLTAFSPVSRRRNWLRAVLHGRGGGHSGPRAVLNITASRPHPERLALSRFRPGKPVTTFPESALAPRTRYA